MKYFSVAVLCLSVFSPFVVSSPALQVNRDVQTEGLKEDLQTFFNKDIIYPIVEAATPIIKKEVHSSFGVVMTETLGRVPEIIDAEWEEKLNKKWKGEDLAFIGDKIVKPIKARAIELKKEITSQIGAFFNNVSGNAEVVAVDAVKRATKQFFAVGPDHHVEPVKVNLTLTGFKGWVQRHMEEFHGNVMLQMTPAMAVFVVQLAPSVNGLIKGFVHDGLEFVVGPKVAKSSLGAKIMDWMSQELADHFNSDVAKKLEKASTDSVVMTNKIMRELLYAKVPFLKGEAAKINQQIH